MFETIIEPFKIKVAEPINLLTRPEREKILKKAGYNLFCIPAADVTIDFLTDSGTSAMSAKQWGAMMEGDESYAGSRSYIRFEKVVQELTGFKHIIPTHQGRAAEHILFQIICREGMVVPNNTHFDTTRANVEYSKASALDLITDQAMDTKSFYPFKGNMDVAQFRNVLKEYGPERIPVVMLTVTNNALGGQPVSMANIEEVSQECKTAGIPLFLDACRFAENAYFIKKREAAYKDWSIRAIAEKMFSLCDGCTMSAKKDGLVNMGGFLALNSKDWAERARNMLILTEGFPTYGGLAGRDLEAMAQGLQEVTEENYLTYRCRSTEYLGHFLMEKGVPVLMPAGGHAAFIDASTFLPHIPRDQFPGQALACEIYLEGGIRSVEIGSLMFGSEIGERPELVRMAIPRRVYTQSHVDYCVEVIHKVFKIREQIKGLRLTYEAPFLRHFTAQLEPI